MLLQNSLSNVIKGIFINIPRSSDIYWLSPLCERWCFRSSNLNDMSELLQGLCICQIEKNMRPVITHEKVVKLLWERIYKASWNRILNSMRKFMASNLWSLMEIYWEFNNTKNWSAWTAKKESNARKRYEERERKCQSNNGHLQLRWELIRIYKIILLDSAGQKSLVLYFWLRNENGS